MSSWRVLLNGSTPSLEFLAQGGQAKEDAPEWSISRDGERFYLTRPDWVDSASGATVHEFAEKLCFHINLIMAFLARDMAGWKPVSISQVQFVDDFGQIVLQQIWTHTGIPVAWTGKRRALETDDLPPVRRLAQAFERDAELRDAISLIVRHGDNWTQLCKVIELARKAPGGIPLTWASKTKIDKLMHTAQFRSTAGETARHISGPGSTPPPDPMPLPEAQAIVRLVAMRWLYREACNG